MDQMMKLKRNTLSTSTPTSSRKTNAFIAVTAVGEEISNIKTNKAPVINLVIEAIEAVGLPRKGASYQAIKKWVLDKQEVRLVNLKLAMRKGIEKGQLIRPGKSEANGLVGFFRLPKEIKETKSRKIDKPETSAKATKLPVKVVQKSSSESAKNAPIKTNEKSPSKPKKVARKLLTKTNKYQVTAGEKTDSKVAKKSPKKGKKMANKVVETSGENKVKETSPEIVSKGVKKLQKRAEKKITGKTVVESIENKASVKETGIKAAKKLPRKTAKKLPKYIVDNSPEIKKNLPKTKKEKGVKKMEYAKNISDESESENEKSKESKLANSANVTRKNTVKAKAASSKNTKSEAIETLQRKPPKKITKKLPSDIEKSYESEEEKLHETKKGRGIKKIVKDSLEYAENISNESESENEESKESESANSSNLIRKYTVKAKTTSSKFAKNETIEALHKKQEIVHVGKELIKKNAPKSEGQQSTMPKVKDNIEDQSNDTKGNKTGRYKKPNQSKVARKDLSDTEIDVKKKLYKSIKACSSDTELEISKREEAKSKAGSKAKKEESKVLPKKIK